MGKIFIFLIFINLIIENVHSQELNFEHFTIEQGLSQNSVKCIYQDRKGYLWVGTDDGLDRYDGYSFSVFRSVREDKNTISDNIITSILEDHEGNLWIGTYDGGLNKFDRKTQTFKRYLSDKKDKNSIPENFIRGIYEDKRHTLWIYNLLVCKYLPETDNFKRIDIHLNFPKNPIHFFYEDKDNFFWMGTEKGLYKYHWTNGTYEWNRPRPDEQDSLSNSIISISEDADGILWLGSNRGLYKFDKNTNQFLYNWTISDKLKIQGFHTDVTSLINDHSSLWIAWQSWDNSARGISRLNKKTNLMTIIYNKPSNISDMLRINMCEDNSGNIWVGTYLGGLLKFEKEKKFHSMMNGSTIGAFLEDNNGVLWIGSNENGLFRFEKSTNKLTNYRADKNRPNWLKDNFVTYLYKDYRNMIWLGTMDQGLYKVSFAPRDPKQLKFEQVMPGVIKSITEDLQHHLWIGLDGSLSMIDQDHKKIISYLKDPQNPNSISSTSIQVSVLDSTSGDLWIGTWDGLDRAIIPKNGEITKDNLKFISLKFDIKDIHSMSDNRVISLCMSKKGILWAGTLGNGFNKIEFDRSAPYQKTTYKIKRYNEENGLPNNQVYGILEDTHGQLWISTNKGLSRFDPVQESFQNFDVKDGLQSNEFFWRAYYKGPSGTMYFGGINGYNAFNPDSIKLNTYIPPVYITGFSIFNKEQTPGSPGSPLKTTISETKELIINYDQSVISFEYVALNYIIPQKNKYAYKMEGFDKEWQYVGTQRKATYTNLDPGTYTFRVKASNNDEIWNTQGTSLILIIKPPFWKTLWFRLIAILIILILLVNFYFYRIASIRRRNFQLEKLVKERTQEIEEKNKILSEQSESINETNTLLEERQQQIEEQSEELKAQRDQLSQLNVTKDKIFSILAHDLRNPFHVIMGFSELLETDFKNLTEDKIKRFLGLITTSSKRGNDLLDNILQWSRTQTGRISFEPDAQVLSIVAKEVINLLEGAAQQKNIKIKQYIDPEIIVIADENMLKTIFRNFISNAIKFTNENGSITIKSEISINNAYVEIAISDTGVGIPETTMKNLFRIDTTVTTKGTAQESGTGLGLIICKEFVEHHKGKVWVQSQVNLGSTFYFTLPYKN